jgi:hypothetical protein
VEWRNEVFLTSIKGTPGYREIGLFVLFTRDVINLLSSNAIRAILKLGKEDFMTIGVSNCLRPDVFD